MITCSSPGVHNSRKIHSGLNCCRWTPGRTCSVWIFVWSYQSSNGFRIVTSFSFNYLYTSTEYIHRWAETMLLYSEVVCSFYDFQLLQNTILPIPRPPLSDLGLDIPDLHRQPPFLENSHLSNFSRFNPPSTIPPPSLTCSCKSATNYLLVARVNLMTSASIRRRWRWKCFQLVKSYVMYQLDLFLLNFGHPMFCIISV